MTRKAFVSGPIQGMEERQGYRDKISNILRKFGYEPVDPWKREKILYRGPPEDWWSHVPSEDFIRRDLEDIERCDVLVAYLPKLSAGTCMELFYAKLKGKKTVTICGLKNPSPWIVKHSDIIVRNVREFEALLKERRI